MKMKLRKLDNRAISGAAAVVLIVFMLIASIGGTVGYLVYTGKLQIGGGGSGGGGGTGALAGSFTVQSYAYDSLATTTTRTMATDVIVNYYQNVNGIWSQLGVAAASTYSSITMSGDEGGYLYAVVTTSSSYYLDAAKSAQMNNGMTYVGYENVLGSAALPQYVFKVNMNGMVPGNRATADLNLNFYAITYDSSIAFSSSATTITGVGTALNTTYLKWTMAASAVSKGALIRQITLSTNDTSSATQTLYRQNIPGVGNINGGTLTVSPQASAIVYTWNAPTNPLTGAVDLGTCIPWTYSSGSINEFNLQTGIQSTLTAALKDSWIITVYWLTPAGAGGSATQTWIICTTTATA